MNTFKKKKLILVTLSFIMLLNAVFAYTLNENYISEEDAYSKILVYPHTDYNPTGNFTQIFSLTNKTASTQNIYVAYLFQKDLIKGTVEYYTPPTYNWVENETLNCNSPNQFIYQLNVNPSPNVNHIYCYRTIQDGNAPDYNITIFDRNFSSGNLQNRTVNISNYVITQNESWTNVTNLFSTYHLNGKPIYYTSNTISFSAGETKKWRLKYTPDSTTTDKKWEMAYYTGTSPACILNSTCTYINKLDPWWNSNWTYKKAINLTGTPGAGTNYQIPLRIYKGTGIDANNTIFTNSTILNDFNDLRFTDSTDTNKLDYWIEHLENGNHAKVWVEVDANLSINQTIHAYWGNANATPDSNGINTFLFFDDFNRTDSSTIGNGWSEVEASNEYTIADNKFVFTGVSRNENVYASKAAPTTGNNFRYLATISLTTDVDASLGYVTYAEQAGASYPESNNGDSVMIFETDTNTQPNILMSIDDGSTAISSTPLISGAISSNYFCEVVQSLTNTDANLYIWTNPDKTSYLGVGIETITATNDTADLDTMVLAASQIGGTGTKYGSGTIDNVALAKYTTPEPSVSSTDPIETATTYQVTFNVYRKNTTTHLTNITADWNNNIYDVSGQNSPFTQSITTGNYTTTFSRTGYDNNTNYPILSDSNKTYTIYLNDSTAPTIGATTVSGFTIAGAYITGIGNIVSGTATDTGSDINTDSCEYTYNNGLNWFPASWDINHCVSTGFTIAPNTYYDFNFRVKDNAGNLAYGTKTSTYFSYLESPTLKYTINTNNGFASDFNVSFTLTCYSNTLYNIAFDVNSNDTNNVYHATDSNGVTHSSSIIINPRTSTTLTFTCTDSLGNVINESATPIYAVLFRLVNENTGALLSIADLNTFRVARAYSVDGNYSYDFNATSLNQISFVGQSALLDFEFGYPDALFTKLNRWVNPSLLNDYNIGVCVPSPQETIYEQLLTSNQQRQVVMKNEVADCYVLASTLGFGYDVGYSLRVFTINKPYYLYLYSDGVQSILNLMDGSKEGQINLDSIIFSRQDSNLSIGLDGIAITPLLNSTTHVYDTNTIQIYYKNIYNDNTKVNILIYADTNVVFNYTNTTSPNEFVVNFYWGGIPGLTGDSNNLTLVLTKTNSSGTSWTTTYFGLYGKLVSGSTTVSKFHIFAAIASLLIFFFGITVVAASRVFGVFGIVVCIIAIIIAGLSWQVWYIQLLEACYLVVLFFILIMGKPGNVMVVQ